MKVKSVKNCTGVGYENFKEGEVRNLPEKVAKKLIKFGYAEGTKATETKPKDETDTDKSDNKE